MANSDENVKSVSFSFPSSFTKKGTSIINVSALKRALTGESSEESKVGNDNLTYNESNESFYSVKSATFGSKLQINIKCSSWNTYM